MAEITNAELARRIDSGFHSVKEDLRMVQGRLDQHAEKIGHHEVKLAVVAATKPDGSGKGGDTTPITRWDLTVFGAGLYLLVEFLPKVGAFLK